MTTNKIATEKVKVVHLSRRPPFITLICLLSFAYILIRFYVYMPYIGATAGFRPQYMWQEIASLTGTLLCTIGVWYMKRWSLFGYVGYLILFAVYLGLNEELYLSWFTIPIVFASLCFLYIRKMK